MPPIINEHHFNLFSNRPIHVKFFLHDFYFNPSVYICFKVGLYGIMIKTFFRHFLIFSLNSLYLDSFSFQKTLSMLNLFSSEMCISPRPLNDKNESSTKICTLFNYVSLYVFYSSIYLDWFWINHKNSVNSDVLYCHQVVHPNFFQTWSYRPQ